MEVSAGIWCEVSVQNGATYARLDSTCSESLGGQRECRKQKTGLEEAVWRPLPYIEGESEES